MNFKIQNNKNRNVELTMVPLIDLFLIILLFFLVSTSFNQYQFLSLNLPQTKASSSSESADNVIAISMNAQHEVFLNKKKVSVSQLLESNEIKDYSSEKKIVVAADSKAEHGQVIDLIDKLQQKGYLNISIVSNDSKGRPE